MQFLKGKYKEVLQKEKHSPFGFNSDIEDYIIRNEFRTKVSWHIPSQSLINEMKRFSPIVSVGAGHAYTEFFAQKKGVDIIATDIRPDEKNLWCKGKKTYIPVEKITDRKAVLKYKDRNVFMAWPPYCHPMATQVAKAMRPGRVLIYVGESHGGCTAGDDFFSYASNNLEKLETEVKIENWFGIYDKVFLYVKK